MDDLKKAVSNISLYDVKAYVRKAQNAVLNYTEMEAKVREATNNEPWGASSTLMQEIADGTHSYSHFHEIMPMIYKRFTEKSTAEWRQIYKALQLLEFLVKNGSERVVDYARSHIAVIQMLKVFRYEVDGRDHGINVRNRAKELVELLGSVDKIRSERKLARANKSKYSGIAGGSSFSSAPSYAGFGSDSYGGSSTGPSFSGDNYGSDSFGSSAKNGSGYDGDDYGYGGYSGGRVFGDGGGFGGSNYEGPAVANDDDFEEYEVETVSTRPGGSTAAATAPTPVTKAPAAASTTVDLFSFDDAPASSSTTAAAVTSADDDFDDFQSATPVAATAPSSSAAAPASSSAGLIDDIFSATMSSSNPTSSAPSQTNTILPSFTTSTPSPAISNITSPVSSTSQPSFSNQLTGTKPPVNKKAADDAFGGLWSSASKKPSTKPAQPTNLASMAKQSASDSMWGTSNTTGSTSTGSNGATTSYPSDSLI